MSKDVVVQFRVTAGELAAMKAKAAKVPLSLSEWIRTQVNAPTLVVYKKHEPVVQTETVVQKPKTVVVQPSKPVKTNGAPINHSADTPPLPEFKCKANWFWCDCPEHKAYKQGIG